MRSAPPFGQLDVEDESGRSEFDRRAFADEHANDRVAGSPTLGHVVRLERLCCWARRPCPCGRGSPRRARCASRRSCLRRASSSPMPSACQTPRPVRTLSSDPVFQLCALRSLHRVRWYARCSRQPESRYQRLSNPRCGCLVSRARELRSDRNDSFVDEDERVDRAVRDPRRRQRLDDVDAHHRTDVRVRPPAGPRAAYRSRQSVVIVSSLIGQNPSASSTRTTVMRSGTHSRLMMSTLFTLLLTPYAACARAFSSGSTYSSTRRALRRDRTRSSASRRRG